MTDEELLAAYLLQFGEQTILRVECQTGEADFLLVLMAQERARGVVAPSVWARICEAYRARGRAA